MNPRIAATICIAITALAPRLATAQVASIYQEQGELMRASRTVGVLGAGLFGDNVDLYTGKLSFSQTDVSLPGNNTLPVAVGRTLATGGANITNRVDGAFADWELAIPHLQGVFAQSSGWQAAGAPTGQRCSYYGPAPQVGGSGGPSDWAGVEYWFGNFLVMPGAGSQEILWNPNNGNVPSDGNAWPLTTKGLWALGCITTGMSYGSGEGFVARAPDGTQYVFDHMVSRPYPAASKAGRGVDTSRAQGGSGSDRDSNPVGPGTDAYNGGLLYRVEVWIMPTVVTDRYGNTVTYRYSASEPWKVTSIEASDGRVITIGYVAAGNPHIASVSDGTHTWTYSYHYNGASFLDTVTLPDNSYWQFNADALTYSNIPLYTASPSCEDDGGIDTRPVTGTMRHPSGATGSFTAQATSHGKSFVNRVCYDHGDGTEHAYYPRYFAVRSLIGKTLSGPGVPAETWSYSYDNATNSSSWSDCTGTCQDWKTVTVTDPRNVATRYTFGNRHMVTEGELQKVEAAWNGTSALRTTTTHYRAADAGPYPTGIGVSFQPRGNGQMAANFTPMDQRVISQQGVDFSWAATGPAPFDTKARPVSVVKSSSLGYSRTEDTVYADNTTKWVLGQIGSVTAAGKVMVSNTYDPATASLLSSSHFGRLDQTNTYATDGTLATRKDGLNHVTTFSQYKRGIAQQVAYASGTEESATVDDLGSITSTTDPNGYTTTYSYDAMNRLSAVHWPANDSVAWNATTMSLDWITAAEVGIEAGHWRQTVSTGSATTYVVFDALLRPRYSETLDMPNLATDKTVVRNFDSDNRTTFVSYPKVQPASIFTALLGTTTTYDALGRVAQVQADSEVGALTTTTEYLGGFQKRVTNPRGFATTRAFQAFDEPTDSAITEIWAPEDQTTVIQRDVFAKPTAITRSGTYPGTGTEDPAEAMSVTRSYVYDTHGEVLCKTVEPEIGATIEAHDEAGNLGWRATGLSATGLTGCDYASVPAAKKISYSYDGKNQLLDTTYGDGSPSITRTRWPDGLLHTLGSGNSARSYDYNQRRLPTAEQLTRAGGPTAVITTSYDANGNVQSTTYPDGAVVAYNPNALGEPSQVGGYATGISYFPNGTVAGYTLGNGIAHTTTQNLRNLPRTVSESGVYQDQYDYDANGNVSALTDLQQGVTTKSMTYDGLDRLTGSTAPNEWGTATYAYDPVDNLRRSVIAPRDSIHHYTNNLLQYIAISGQPSLDYGYDLQGNVISRGGQVYNFDIGNRMQLASGLETYEYDGNGLRFNLTATNGRTKFQMYAQNGKLMYGTEQAPGYSPATVRYMYLGGKLIAETYGDGTTSYVHTDGLGSPVARSSGTSATPGPYTRYEPYGNSTAAGPVPNPIGFTGHVNDVDTGMIYMQQRYYDSWAGRFLSVDPVVTDASSGSAFGRFHYASNNPYSYVDPDGRDDKKIGECGWMRSVCDDGSIPTQGSEASKSYVAPTPAAPITPGTVAGPVSGSSAGLAGTIGWIARILGGIGLAIVPSELGDGTLYGMNGAYAPKHGVPVYRVWGGEAGPLGRSWTPIDPSSLGNSYRDLAGLPSVNDGTRLSKGLLVDTTGVIFRPAIPLSGNRGGLPEYVVPNPAAQINAIITTVRSPPF